MVGLIAFGLLAAPFFAARAANTPAQDRALQAWDSCTTGPTTARLDLIEVGWLCPRGVDGQSGASSSAELIILLLVSAVLFVAVTLLLGRWASDSLDLLSRRGSSRPMSIRRRDKHGADSEIERSATATDPVSRPSEH